MCSFHFLLPDHLSDSDFMIFKIGPIAYFSIFWIKSTPTRDHIFKCVNCNEKWS